MNEYVATLVFSPWDEVALQARADRLSYMVSNRLQPGVDELAEATRLTQAVCGMEVPGNRWTHFATLVTPTETVRVYWTSVEGHVWVGSKLDPSAHKLKIEELMYMAMRTYRKVDANLFAVISYAFAAAAGTPPVKLVLEKSLDGLPV
jgi:hypothetical protein